MIANILQPNIFSVRTIKRLLFSIALLGGLAHQFDSLANAQGCMVADCVEANQTQLPVYQWAPERKARGAVILVHGLMQNAEILSPLAMHLADRGFIVYAIDQRGHGYWHFAKKSSQPGYRIDYKQTVKDVVKLSNLVRREHPEIPLFCIGESAGAAVCVQSAAVSPDTFDGIILCALGTKTAPIKWKWVIPDLMRDSYCFDHMISMERYEDRYTTEDSRTLVETLSDIRCRPTLSAREVLRTTNLMRGMKKWATKLPQDVPILVLEGANDKTMNPKSSPTFLAAANSRQKRLIMVPNSGHVLIGTSFVKPLVSHAIDNFLDSRSAPKPMPDERIAISN